MSVQTAKSKIIGLTGSIATGKTTVSNYLNKKGYLVIDSDKIVSDLLLTDKLINQLKKYEVIENNQVDKKKLATLIFNDEGKRMEINQIIHPKVFEEIDKVIQKHQTNTLIFIDMPLLIETGYYKRVDEVIVVYTTKLEQLKRLMIRNQLTKEEAEKRINSQISIEEKVKYATHVLDNTKTLEHLYQSIEDYLKRAVEK